MHPASPHVSPQNAFLKNPTSTPMKTILSTLIAQAQGQDSHRAPDKLLVHAIDHTAEPVPTTDLAIRVIMIPTQPLHPHPRYPTSKSSITPAAHSPDHHLHPAATLTRATAVVVASDTHRVLAPGDKNSRSYAPSESKYMQVATMTRDTS